jgi:hypothetical protein
MVELWCDGQAIFSWEMLLQKYISNFNYFNLLSTEVWSFLIEHLDFNNFGTHSLHSLILLFFFSIVNLSKILFVGQ